MRQMALIVFLCLLAGCAQPVVLHPIEQTDIIALEEGQEFAAPKDGYFLSTFYVKEIMAAKIR